MMPNKDAGARVVTLLGTVQDVTERKRMEERLMEAQKLEAIGQLTGGLAHDFNNLLGIILGNLDLLEPLVVQNASAHRHHGFAWNAAQRAAQITKSLLAVARKQALEPRDVDVGETLAEMSALIRESVGSAITVCESRGPECAAGVFAHVDPAGLGNAILNLVMNARDAMPAGGEFHIETELRSVEAEDIGAPPDLAPGRYIVLSFADNGIGMPPEVAARAFDPFFTTKERGHGTGLGLSRVYGFARQSGGTASIFSQPGLGTTVHLFLPAVEAGSRRMPGKPPEALAAGHGERILVVDDEEMLLEVAHEWLKGLGYRVAKRASPAQALDILRSETFDLLLTDVTMPGMSGMELAERALALHPGLRVLLASGFAEDMLPGAWPLLEKPYSREQLAHAVVGALSGSARSAAPGESPRKPPVRPGKPSRWYARIIDRLVR
jgi:nitrogen-specific signal transduction histidine kinase/CheY-like chemotaxis protein